MKKIVKKSTFARFSVYILKSRGLLAASILCAVISVTFSLAGPLFIGRAIDAMTGPNNVNFAAVFRIVIILAVIYTLGSVFTWFLTYITNRLSYKTVSLLRKDLFDKLNKLPLRFYDTSAHGDVISRFINDADFVGDGMLQAISSILTGVVTIIGSIAFMLSINALMTGVVILSAIVTFFMARFITTRSRKFFAGQTKRLGALNGYAEEILTGQKTVKAFGYGKRSCEVFAQMNGELYEAGVKSQFYGSLTNPSTRFVNNIAYSVVGVIGAVLAVTGRITIGNVSSFLIYSNLFSKPFNEITGVFTQIQTAAASVQRIFAVLDEECEIPDAEDAVSFKHSADRSADTVSFEHVAFSYLPEKPLITDMNLRVEPGRKVAIVGKTGAGKTTLVNLLMRFYEISGGVISVRGNDIRKVARNSLRCSFGMVLQDTFLFADTIRSNIAYGRQDATDEEVTAAAKASGADSFIRRLPQGYNTRISSSGDNLSQGQKQLLTITRAMIADPPMLILDEATSNIDTRTELNIQKAFLKIMKGRTTFIIAHRLSTIKDADIILVMDKGDIVETGTHEDLLKKSGLYASIYNSQFPVEPDIERGKETYFSYEI